MATTDAPRPDRRTLGYALASVLALGLAVLAWVYWNRPPQMGPAEGPFKTVDALYTAVRGRDETRLADCETRLKSFRASGELPPAAADELDAVIGRARGGSWQAAAERLYAFMLAQERTGATGEPRPKPKKAGKG